ncbi:AraC family transcriptional regulator [Microbulbifer marinus]|uniref:AraC-type DNA-binding protein n=1 Tax=Microbulbifer marinus TaxID=658218 RepID=A0A1H4A4B8_9GAMM|nr:AraC family transcriptional regulator [Microbulbifer marinus]SEA30638.1 AraC-type DNA-binding protein [Microbulbifer marinus]
MLPMVRASALSGYKKLLQSYGVDADQLLARLSLPADYLDRPDLMIPLETKVELLELGAECSGCEHFGLELAQRQNISMLGALGLLVQQCPTLRDALTTISTSIGQAVQGLDAWLEERDDLAYLRATYRLDGPQAQSRQHNDNTLIAAYNIICFLLNERVALRSVYLRGPEPTSIAPYNATLNAPIVFASDCNGLVFDRSYLDRPVVGANPEMRGLIDGFLKKKQLDDFQERLLWLITNLLPRGPVTLETVAENIGMAPRTLQARLGQLGTSFQQLLDRARTEQVCTYMLDGDLSLTEIAELVGYSQLSALTRGFKRIMGASPAAWRRQMAAQPAAPARSVK